MDAGRVPWIYRPESPERLAHEDLAADQASLPQGEGFLLLLRRAYAVRPHLPRA